MSDPVSAVYKVICAWCGAFIRFTTGTNGDSHGICPDCYKKQLKDLGKGGKK